MARLVVGAAPLLGGHVAALTPTAVPWLVAEVDLGHRLFRISGRDFAVPCRSVEFAPAASAFHAARGSIGGGRIVRRRPVLRSNPHERPVTP